MCFQNVLKLKVTKGELIISNHVEMADRYLLGGGARGAPPTLVRVKILVVLMPLEVECDKVPQLKALTCGIEHKSGHG